MTVNLATHLHGQSSPVFQVQNINHSFRPVFMSFPNAQESTLFFFSFFNLAHETGMFTLQAAAEMTLHSL